MAPAGVRSEMTLMVPTPCPIPECSLEVVLAAMLVVIGASVAVVDPSSLVLTALLPKPLLVPPFCIRAAWAAALIIAGGGQLAALATSKRILHRWSAVLSMIVMLCFTIAQFQGFHIPVLAGICALVTVSEFLVFTLLRGATWRSG